MKKHIKIVLFFLFFIITAYSYFSIFPIKSIDCNHYTTAPSGAINRLFANKTAMKKWLPNESISNADGTYNFEGCKFKVVNTGNDINGLQIIYKDKFYSSNLFIQEQNEGNNIMFSFPTNNKVNFLNGISNYIDSKHIKSAANNFLSAFNNYVSTPKNIYGIAFIKSTLTDSTLISLKANSDIYPTVLEIYSNLDILKKYAKLNNVKETNSPMLNITKNEMNTYNYMVALPVSGFLQNSGNIVAKRMLNGGSIILSDTIIGGFNIIEEYTNQIENYKDDYNYMSPAIPYQSLITDRRVEKDSTKWKTKLYIPIF